MEYQGKKPAIGKAKWISDLETTPYTTPHHSLTLFETILSVLAKRRTDWINRRDI